MNQKNQDLNWNIHTDYAKILTSMDLDVRPNKYLVHRKYDELIGS